MNLFKKSILAACCIASASMSLSVNAASPTNPDNQNGYANATWQCKYLGVNGVNADDGVLNLKAYYNITGGDPSIPAVFTCSAASPCEIGGIAEPLQLFGATIKTSHVGTDSILVDVTLQSKNVKPVMKEDPFASGGLINPCRNSADGNLSSLLSGLAAARDGSVTFNIHQ